MRRNRTKTRSKSKKNNLTIIVFIALLFIGAPLIGFLGTRYFLIPKYFNNQQKAASSTVNENTTEELRKKIENKTSASNEKNEETQPKEEQSSEEKLYTFEIPALSIYNIQVGSFDNKQHAQNQIDSLNEKGLGGYIIDTDRFRVVAMSFTERSEAEKYKEEIKNHYSDAFISPRELSLRSINYEEKGKEYSEAAAKGIDELKKYYQEFSEFLASEKILNSNETIQFIDSEVNRLEKIDKLISSVSPTEEFSNFNNRITEIVKTSKEKLTKVKGSNLSDKKQLFEIFMESINSYDNII